MSILLGPLGLMSFLGAVSPLQGSARGSAPSRPWPSGTEVLSVQDIEGVILVNARLKGMGSRDTTGFLALDSGAGFLALDRRIALALGILDSLGSEEIRFADHPLPRLEVGTMQADQVTPVLTADVGLIRRLTDRPVLGLLGQQVLSSHTVMIDYREQTVALIPGDPKEAEKPDTTSHVASGPRDRSAEGLSADIARSRAGLAGVLSPRARPVSFRLAGDRKMLVRARVSNPQPPRFSDWLTLIVDTGATKCVMFEQALAELVSEAGRWPTLSGLLAPTLLGTSNARLARIPAVELEASPRNLRCTDVDTALMQTEISGVLSRAVAEPVHGLLGYSFLRHYDVAIDYPHRILWLDPLRRPANDRPYEYSQVGLQLERQGETLRVMGVAQNSPAARAGIGVGDELTAIDGQSTAKADIISVTRRLEGPPGTYIVLTIRRGSKEHSYPLIRRRLL